MKQLSMDEQLSYTVLLFQKQNNAKIVFQIIILFKRTNLTSHITVLALDLYSSFMHPIMAQSKVNWWYINQINSIAFSGHHLKRLNLLFMIFPCNYVEITFACVVPQSKLFDQYRVNKFMVLQKLYTTSLLWYDTLFSLLLFTQIWPFKEGLKYLHSLPFNGRSASVYNGTE